MPHLHSATPQQPSAEGYPSPESLIPHRPPFLFVDEIVELAPGLARTRLKVDPQASYFKGHYPGNPLMPGVLLCEAIFQTAALCLIQSGPQEEKEGGNNRITVLTKVEEARFRQVVRPGDQLELKAVLKEKVGHFFLMEGTATCEGRLVVSLSCTLALSEVPPPQAL